MKICHITSYMPNYHKIWAGAEIAFYSFVKILYQRKQQNIALATKPIKKVDEPYFTFDCISTLADYIGNIPAAALASLMPFDFVAYFSLKRKLKKIRPDAVHLHNFGAFTPSIVYAANKIKVPVVFSAYDYWSICPMESLIDYKENNCKFTQGAKCWKCILKRKLGFARVFLLPLRNIIFNKMLKKIDQYNILSPTWATPLKKAEINESKINVVPLPLSEKIVPPKTISKENSIIFIGWIEKRKGLEIIVKAMPKVCSQFKDAKLYVVGPDYDKEYKENIIDLTKKNNLKDNIIFLGKRPHKETISHLKKSFIAVVPEQWEIAWPIALTEAMAFEKPIVTSRIGGIPGFIKNGENGFLAEPKNHKEFADKIIFLMKNRKKAVKMGKKARKTILNICDEGKIFKSLMNTYSKAMEDKNE